MNSTIKWILALVPIMMVQISHADPYYKWVDEQGATHYTQTPPPQKAAKKVNVNTLTPSDSANEIKNLNAQSSKSLKDDDTDEQAAEKAKADADATAARRKKNGPECQQLHASLALLQSGQRLRTSDANGGSIVTEDQKASQIQQQSAQIQKDCS